MIDGWTNIFILKKFVKKDERRSFLMGQRFTLSFSDIKMANLAYNCNGNFLENRENILWNHKHLSETIKKKFCKGKCSDIKICQNEGFMNENCACICPDQISGEFCELVNTKQRKFFIKALKSNSSMCGKLFSNR